MQTPSPHSGAQVPQRAHAFWQQSPASTHAGLQPQLPPEPPHSQSVQLSGSSGQSSRQEQVVSEPLQVPSPQAGGQIPQPAHELSQQLPAATQPGAHEQAPPLAPH